MSAKIAAILNTSRGRYAQISEKLPNPVVVPRVSWNMFSSPLIFQDRRFCLHESCPFLAFPGFLDLSSSRFVFPDMWPTSVQSSSSLLCVICYLASPQYCQFPKALTAYSLQLQQKQWYPKLKHILAKLGPFQVVVGHSISRNVHLRQIFEFRFNLFCQFHCR